MDHNKTILIVAISIVAIILASFAGFTHSSNSAMTETTTTSANTVPQTQQTTQSQSSDASSVTTSTSPPQPTPASESPVVASQPDYRKDVHGCGADGSVYCASSDSCVKPGTCAASPVYDAPPVK